MPFATLLIALAFAAGTASPFDNHTPVPDAPNLRAEDKAASDLGERTTRFIEVFTPLKKAELEKIAAYESAIEPDGLPDLMDMPKLDHDKLQTLATQLAESQRKAEALAQVIEKARAETVDKIRAAKDAIGNADFARGAADGVARRYKAEAPQYQKMADAMVVYYQMKLSAALLLIGHAGQYRMEKGDLVFDEQADADTFKELALESDKASKAFHAIYDNPPN